MLKRIPFLKFFLAYAFGILFAYNYSFININLLYTLLTTWGLGYTIVLIFTKNTLNSSAKSISLGFLAQLFLITAGYIGYVKHLPAPNGQFKIAQKKSEAVFGVISQSVVVRGQSTNAILECQKVYIESKWQPSKGKILLTILNNNSPIKCGDQLLVMGNAKPITNRKTIGAFDEEKYYGHQHIYEKMTINATQWSKTGRDESYIFKRISEQWRKYCEEIIEKNITTSNEANISKALLLGVRTTLDKDLKQAYSNVGVIHILAVSGMHVALLFLLFNFFLKRFMIYNWGERYLPFLFLLLLWSFAFLTGLSASVVRAVVMFSFLLLAQIIGRKNNTINTIFVSAFVMLLYDAHYLFDVGFQLSYLAVLGIVWIHPWLFEKIIFKSKFPSMIWEAMSVTLAAQLVTTPLCIYYFHQFPTFFLPANLVLVFITNIIMYGLVLLMAFSWMAFLPSFIGAFIQWLLAVVNKIVMVVDKLPLSIIEFANISVAQTTFIYILIIGIILLLFNKKMVYAYFCIAASIGFSGSTIWQHWLIHQRKELLLISTDRLAVGWLDGTTLFLPLYQELNKSIKDKLRIYGVKNIIHNVPINQTKDSLKAQCLQGFSMLSHPHKFPHKNLLVQYQTLSLWAYSTKILNNNYHIIYWLKNNPHLPTTNTSKTIHLPYVGLTPNEILPIPISPLAQHL